MKNWYYVIWADAIRNVRKHQPNGAGWKLKIFLYITWAHAINAWMIVVWLKHLDLLMIPTFHLSIFSAQIINGAINFFVEFALIFVILNYVLIFQKNRYEKILDEYPETGIKYSMIYSFSVFIGAFASAMLLGLVLR